MKNDCGPLCSNEVMTPITPAALAITLSVEKIIELLMFGMQLLTWIMLFPLHQFVRITRSYLFSPARTNSISSQCYLELH